MEKNKAAQDLARLRHSRLTPEERSENARRAGKGNAKKKRKKSTRA